jgi:hypothetical protein
MPMFSRIGSPGSSKDVVIGIPALLIATARYHQVPFAI